MRKFLLHAALFILIAFNPAWPAEFPHRTSLNGTWDYRPLARTTLKSDGSIAEDKSNLPPGGKMPVPSNWHLDGLPNFNGRVRFERNFDFAERPAAADRVFLIFRGVDYFADVELNGVPIGRHEGYFQAFEFDVTPQLKLGRNHLAVTVDAPLEEPGTVWPDHKRMIKGVFSHWDCKPGNVFKATGQDGTTAGIWNDVELEIRRTAWLGNVKIQPVLHERKQATGKNEDNGLDANVFVTAEVRAARAGSYVLTAEAGSAKVTTKVEMTSNDATVVLVLPMERPKLWWTWDLGDPYLYTCELTLAADSEVVYARDIPFGVRSIELDEKTGDWRLNGVRFFIRGTNIVPDLWLARYTPARIAEDIRLLRLANVNGVRVCVHVNREELYDALDRAGIVAWQDFPLQWDYTHTPKFLTEAARQLRDMIRQFYNHPSIITWVCQNESTAYNVNVLDPFLARVGAQEDSSRPVRPTSVYAEHHYQGWYGGDYYNYLATPGGPIISELGAQALPSLEETRQMFGEAWPPDWQKMAYHDFQYEQTFHVAKIPMGSNWAEFVRNSQQYQADLIKFAIEHYRRVKYQKVGSFFHFLFGDCWPSVTWSVVSFERKPKPGYFALQRAYQPVLIGADLGKTVWSKGKNLPAGAAGGGASATVWVVNDQHRTLEGVTCEALLRGHGKNFLVMESRKLAAIAEDSAADVAGLEFRLPAEVSPGVYDLVLALRQGDRMLSENSYPVTVVE
ncbi:MAG: glycoside hydrolase family 2 protein [Terriglobia bacterium]